MTNFVTERMPYDDAYGQGVKNFEALCTVLGRHGLAAPDLLYVAVEGQLFRDGSEPNNRESTWGSTHANLLKGYQDEASGKTSRKFDLFLWAVHKPGRIVPAVLTYDMKQLVPQSRPPYWGEWYVHQDGGSIDPALAALIYLEPYDLAPATHQ